MHHTRSMAAAFASFALASWACALLLGGSVSTQTAWPAAVRKTPDKAPALSAEEEMKTFALPPGYRIELIAKEPLVLDPIAIDFDADGRLWRSEERRVGKECGSG